MASEGVYLLYLRGIPDLDFAAGGAHAQLVAARGPGDRSDLFLVTEIAEFGHLIVGGGPQVDAGGKGDRQGVLLRPVDQVEVEVVLQRGGVEDLEGDFGDLALDLFVLEAVHNAAEHEAVEVAAAEVAATLQAGALFAEAQDVAVLEGGRITVFQRAAAI